MLSNGIDYICNTLIKYMCFDQTNISHMSLIKYLVLNKDLISWVTSSWFSSWRQRTRLDNYLWFCRHVAIGIWSSDMCIMQQSTWVTMSFAGPISKSRPRQCLGQERQSLLDPIWGTSCQFLWNHFIPVCTDDFLTMCLFEYKLHPRCIASKLQRVSLPPLIFTEV